MFTTKYRPRRKRRGGKRRITIHQLPTELRGPSNNRYGGHEARVIDPGWLWNPPRKKARLYAYSQDELNAEIERLRAEGKID